LGPGPYVCLFCGIQDSDVLKVKSPEWLEARVPRSVLEEHHFYGKKIDPSFIVLLCLNCHRKVTVGYFSTGVEMRHEPDAEKRLLLMLAAEATFFELFAVSRRQLISNLEKEGIRHE
jgi:hypothetical protein